MKSGIALLLIGMVLTGCGGNSTPTMQTNTPKGPAESRTAKGPDENAALDALRKISEAQSTYFKINRRYALTHDELIEAHLLSSEPSAADTGYDFKLRPAADAQTYKLSVVPHDSSAPAARHFLMDQSGVIRAETGKDASADSPAIK